MLSGLDWSFLVFFIILSHAKSTIWIQGRIRSSSGARNPIFSIQYHQSLAPKEPAVSTEVSALMDTIGESTLQPQVHQPPLIIQMIASSVTHWGLCEKQMFTSWIHIIQINKTYHNVWIYYKVFKHGDKQENNELWNCLTAINCRNSEQSKFNQVNSEFFRCSCSVSSNI